MSLRGNGNSIYPIPMFFGCFKEDMLGQNAPSIGNIYPIHVERPRGSGRHVFVQGRGVRSFSVGLESLRCENVRKYIHCFKRREAM